MPGPFLERIQHHFQALAYSVACIKSYWTTTSSDTSNYKQTNKQTNKPRSKSVSMTRRNGQTVRVQKNQIQNVRLVDKDEGTDDVICQRLLSSYSQSEGQIRVVCGYRTEVAPGSAASTTIFDWTALASTDDFISFSSQYTEFRVKAIRCDIYDIQPNSAATVNYWATYHQVGGSVPSSQENVIDRPDSRSVSPGGGKTTLCWVAHSIPEMEFQACNSYAGLGGVVCYTSPAAAVTGSKYTVIVKFLVDFRGRM